MTRQHSHEVDWRYRYHYRSLTKRQIMSCHVVRQFISILVLQFKSLRSVRISLHSLIISYHQSASVSRFQLHLRSTLPTANHRSAALCPRNWLTGFFFFSCTWLVLLSTTAPHKSPNWSRKKRVTLFGVLFASLVCYLLQLYLPVPFCGTQRILHCRIRIEYSPRPWHNYKFMLSLLQRGYIDKKEKEKEAKSEGWIKESVTVRGEHSHPAEITAEWERARRKEVKNNSPHLIL